jgi:hypothetical protein
MAQVNDALDTVDQGNLEGLIGVGMGTVVGRLDESALLHRFQQASGLGSVEAAQKLDTIQTVYQAQADAALNGMGINAEDLAEFYAYARQNHRGALQEAVQMQLRAQHRRLSRHCPAVACLDSADHCSVPSCRNPRSTARSGRRSVRGWKLDDTGRSGKGRLGVID